MINIFDKTKCSGCTACYNVCPKSCLSMIEDNEGFLYPKANQNLCINCGLCEKVCPLEEKNNTTKKGVLYSCIVQHKDKEILRQSTSGGAFTPIAEYVLKHEGIVFGVEMQNDYSIKHISISNKEELIKFRNSKYVQSNVGDCFKEAKDNLDARRMVCFSGTPCQIQGLRNYLRKDYENLILVDVVCRGVPSPGVWRNYSKYLMQKNGRVSSVRFRDKTLGYQYSTMEVKFEDGTLQRNGIESDSWLRMFFSGMIIRPVCLHCSFRDVERSSDFTIWDCFNVSDITNKLDETKGATQMLIHTEKGIKILNEIKESLNIVKSDVKVVSKGVSESPKWNAKREMFYADYHEMQMVDLIQKYFPTSFKVKLKKCGRLFLNKLGLDLFAKKIKRMIKG